MGIGSKIWPPFLGSLSLRRTHWNLHFTAQKHRFFQIFQGEFSRYAQRWERRRSAAAAAKSAAGCGAAAIFVCGAAAPQRRSCGGLRRDPVLHIKSAAVCGEIQFFLNIFGGTQRNQTLLHKMCCHFRIRYLFHGLKLLPFSHEYGLSFY